MNAVFSSHFKEDLLEAETRYYRPAGTWPIARIYPKFGTSCLNAATKGAPSRLAILLST